MSAWLPRGGTAGDRTGSGPERPARSRPRRAVVAVGVALAVAAPAAWIGAGAPTPGAAAGAPSHLAASGESSPAGASVAHRATPPGGRGPTGTVPPTLTVTPARPDPGAAGVDGSAPVVFATTEAVDLSSVVATVSPPVPGTWSSRAGELVFTPTGAFPPSSHVSITLSPRIRGVDGTSPGRPVATSFTTAAGSVLRLQELLAQLGYLPLRWAPAASGWPSGRAAAERAVYQAPAGDFTWRWDAAPPALVHLWTPGQYTVMVKGAVMAFEAAHGLAVDGLAGPQVWTALLAATDGPTIAASPLGYTYALASKTLPETLTVWHDGTVIATTRANTGIPAAPTADGTFPVYERLATQIMRGKNPDGAPYADPVAWVAYFNGGDAIHYIARAAYGYPQSLGCVEVPYQAGKAIWPSLGIGTLVTITG